MPYIAYLDEVGDHSLEIVDREFPLFGVVLFLCDTTTYARQIVPAVYQLKMDYFGHEGVMLHSRDIRKAHDAFAFLQNPQRRQPFYERINRLMEESDYRLIASVIRKQEHKELYGMSAENPYDLALKLAMERLLLLLEEEEQREIQIIAESRGKREDDALRLSFLRTITEGTERIAAERFKSFVYRLDFRPKAMNIVGTQLADLAAYPIARYVLAPDKPNPAYGIVRKRLYQGRAGETGLIVFP
jgi:hypothetical protein